ncbi:MAG: hypothetical protein P9M00_11360 [Candidatus Tritonobacter lacicola]|nr:hypothetical protein [Candidatus Tritonobacter lacicola]
MKKFCCLGIILAAYIPLCGICGSEGRKNLPLRRAILGHWRKATRGSSEYEYRPTFKLVSKAKDGSPSIRTWKILSESGETLKIKVVGVSSWDESIYELEQEMKFSEDRNRITVTKTTIKSSYKAQIGKASTYELIYVDGKQRP